MSDTVELDDVNELDIAVIGMAGRFPGAPDVASFWRNLCEGKESISFFSREELLAHGVPESRVLDERYVPARGVLDDAEYFDAGFFRLSPREAELMDPQHRVFLECGWAALEDAGYDPARFGGSIGVFAGSGMNTYLLYQLLSHGSAAANMVSLAALGNDKDFVATRLAYKLDLRGPALAIQTACSTSLVAIHMACQSLMTGECDMVLAGGVSILLPLREGYLFEAGGINSSDGHCRPFDALAGGTVGGSGVGLVVLKRLRDALADGDAIRAVVKGSAINNDGAGKVGFTAPSVDGQANVIRAAHRAAGIEPESIGYIEAHGTATPIGDPIELAGLAEAFRDAGMAPRSCALGAVKSNIGHLDSASGVAGFIKAVLCVEYGVIPPTLHFRSPNPKIRMQETPFFVNPGATQWPSEGTRRAGVSSFGVGGTNAHVVLEQAPNLGRASEARACEVLTLSARSPEALERASENLLRHLEGLSTESSSLRDIAFTLGVGRRAFRHRRAIVCGSLEEAMSGLRDGRRLRGEAPDESPRIVALFTGQGSQYPRMGRAAYVHEAVYRDAVDQCLAQLPSEERALLHRLLVAGEKSDDAELLARTDVAQIALFVTEYAMARLVESWGIRFDVMLGHSLGEYVAAHLAGVFSLQDALRLVVARGKAMQSCAAGAMLAVGLDEAALQPRLPPSVEIAARNAPSLTVVSGPTEAIEAFSAELSREGVSRSALAASRAFHSSMMAPAAEAFRAELRRTTLHAPARPFYSNVTGALITAEEATSEDYWLRQLRAPVRFADAVSALQDERASVFVELGPGVTLLGLARRQLRGPHAAFVSTMPSSSGPIEAELRVLRTALATLWTRGAPIHDGILAGEGRRVPLPTYPFERQKYWVEGKPAPSPAAEASPAATEAPSGPESDLEKAICAIWQDLLGLAEVGVHDDFLDLGGHSLLAIQVASRLKSTFDVEITVESLYEARTVAELAVLVEDRLIDGLEPDGA